jgi:signal transduction histidine kinase
VIIDLRLAVLVLLAVLTTACVGTILLDRRSRNGRLRGLLQGSPLSLCYYLEEAPFGILVVDTSTVTYSDANTAARRLLSLPVIDNRLPRASWATALCADVASAKDHARVHQRLVRVGSHGYVKWWVLRGLGARAVVLIFDASAQQRLEQSSQALLDALSHELRTPLTAMLAHIALLDDSAALDEFQQSSVDFIRAEPTGLCGSSRTCSSSHVLAR